MRRVLAPLTSLAAVCALALAAAAQVNPPVPPPSGPVNPPGSVATPVPGSPSTPVPAASDTPGVSTTPAPQASPTQPPIIVEPPQVSVEPGKTVTARVNGSLGTVTATVADPAIATVIVDPAQRVLYVSGVKVGTTTATVTDSRGVSRDVPIRVAYAAGSVADETTLRVTGNPTSSDYLREAIALAVTRAATLRSGASINVPLETIPVHGNLKIDDRMELNVASQIAGNGYLPVNGTTHVIIENTALPSIQPARLLVSDYPERLTANGVLFTARLDRTQAQRFLYYHFNPANEPPRRILLKARNASNAPATVQMIDGSAGPGTNEMEVGHLSTKRFLVREARNEGQVMTIAPGATMNLVDHPLPAANVVSAILQLRLVSGEPLDLTLVAQDALAPTDQSVDTVQLLAGGAPHARGVYPVPTFFFERTYDVDGADLDIPIGQLPLPNLREGEALSGDYGVE
ncbi:MAG: pilus assembly protein N-terminal domain-containing protein, partial [Candidatus Eremiobacteraeota bacterium]|nr:pilus assembly protein N-terminal domain-containing protein [Candidatus Eremiobacteraeota bacterium]